MDVIVTGASGFIGQHLCRRLTEAGNGVFGVDIVPGPFTTMIGDVRVNLQLPPADEIYALACLASPKHYLKNQMFTIETCVFGTQYAIEHALHCGAKLLFASTSEVYGDSNNLIKHEDDVGHVDTRSPRSCYDEGKRCAETMLLCAVRERGLRVRIPRIFNTYGPGMSPADGRVVTEMIKDALRGDPIIVHSPGTQTRSFCYVDDTIDALTWLMQAEHPNALYPVNIGNPEGECTMLWLAREIRRLCNSDSEIINATGWPSDPRYRRPSLAKLRSIIDWYPRVALEDGLRKTIAWYRENGI